MTVDEILHIFVEFPPKFFETELRKQCVKTILASGLSKDQVTRVIPPSLSNFILKQLSEADAKILLSSMQISNLKISETEKKFPCEILRELLRLHVQVLTIENCTIPSKLLGTHDLISLQSFSSKLKTLIMNDIYISMHDEKFIKVFGTSMEHIVNFRFGAVSSCDSIHQSDEIFTRLARDHLSKNRFLAHIDLRGSDVDLMATSSRRNILINFAAEMRRWARRLRSLAFDSDVNVCRIFRILNRQCSLLKSLCLRTRGQRTVSDAFDNLKSILETTDLKFKKVEPLPKLTRLCLNGHFRVTDSILKFILPSLNSLQFLNISGCPVNFEHYWHYLPASLEELIVDKCSRLEFIAEHRSSLKQVFQKCKRLKIYVVMSIFKGEDLESLKGLALLNGADSLLSDQINSIAEQSDDGLIGFELRVKELKNCSNCIKLF